MQAPRGGLHKLKKPLANIPKYYYTSCLGQSHAGGIKEMLAVAEIKYIRRQVNNKGCGYSNVAKRMGLDPRTVKKYVIIWEEYLKRFALIISHLPLKRYCQMGNGN